jgi:uncharacterized membrane protein YciS (DUF1049 family)
VIFTNLDLDVQQKLLLGQLFYNRLMAQNGYEFSVAVLAILDLAAPAVLMGEFYLGDAFLPQFAICKQKVFTELQHHDSHVNTILWVGSIAVSVFNCLRNLEGGC